MFPGDSTARAPGRVALGDDTRSISYGELDALLRAEQDWLARSGGSRFGLLADNGCAWALTDLALHRSRLLNVPLPDSFTPAQLTHVIRNAGLDGLLTDRPEHMAVLTSDFRVAGVSAQTGLTLLRRPAPVRADRVPEATVKITYTSGSTGTPRGVCLPASVLEAVASSLADATADLRLTRHLCLLPLATLLENVAGLYAALRSDASCDIPSLATTGMSYGNLDARMLTTVIAAREPSSIILVPELLRVLVFATTQGWRPPASLRFIAVGGAAVSPDLLARATKAGLPVFEGYGLSECGSVVCLNTASARRPGSVGRPLPHVRVRLDEQRQIIVGGAVMSGYLGDAGRDADGLREFETGDLGAIDADGFVYVRGRRKNLIITSLGRNISPEWVERELQHEPAIGAALVQGEARPFLTALISPGRPETTAAEIAAAVARANARLPDYAHVRRWALATEAFSFANGSLTANGRLRRARILELHAAAIEALYQTGTDALRETA